jgi:hypothetical protein
MSNRLEALADFCVAFTRPRSKKLPHRPRGTFQHPELRELIFALYEAIVMIGGGRLTLSQKSWEYTWATAGTLPVVLDILRSSLPEIIPNVVSYSTLRRDLSAAVKDAGPRSARV